MKSDIKKTVKKSTTSFFRYLILIGLSFLILYPLVVTVLISFMSDTDIYDMAVRFIPKNPGFSAYKNALIFLEYTKCLFQSVGIDILLCLMEIFVCLFVSYGFARFDFPFSKLLFGCVILSLLVPYHVYFTPLYLQFQDYGPFHWNLLQTSLPMFLFSLTGLGLKDGLVIYICTQSFKGYPRALEEAASVDGAGPFRVFFNIMLPGSVSVAVTCFMFAFVWKWTDPTYFEVFFPKTEFLWTKMATIDSRFEVLAEAVNNYYFRAILKNACVVLFMLPLVGLFIITKRFLVESIETTGLVG